jgi:UDP-N-acetylglucosamine/UDP-N-acetylgalactosamine 4-epimerase
MNILLTGGAGFIGTNLTQSLLADSRVTKLTVVDNLSNGIYANVKQFLSHPKYSFVEDSIANYDVCLKLCEGVDLVSHQAALGSVPRSIADPIATNLANITGTLNVFTAAKECGVQRVVYAASSSTYGDSHNLPKVEQIIGRPLSPYAVTKYVMELYASVFNTTYGLETIGLRYFNVFGPFQNPQGAYAAVIPLFMFAALNGQNPVINGDGSTSRDFTYVQNAVEANLAALFTQNADAVNQVYNVAFGESTTLLELFEKIKSVSGSSIEAQHTAPRLGDIKHSLADITKAKQLLNYQPKFSIAEGIQLTYDWYRDNAKYFGE